MGLPGKPPRRPIFLIWHGTGWEIARGLEVDEYRPRETADKDRLEDIT